MKTVSCLWLLSVCLFIGSAAGQVEISPGTDIQSVVNGNPPGTTYLLKAGVHSLQSVKPHNGDVYIGEPGAVMSGAIQLTGFTQADSYWFIGDQAPSGVFTTLPTCQAGYDGCSWSEDLFLDNQPLQHVMSLDQLVSGTWYFDMDANTIYIADDPNGRVVERSVTPVAFVSGGYITDVTLQGLVIEKYAAPARRAAIEANVNWTITDSEIRFNHGSGINLDGQATVSGNNIHHNGQMAINGNSIDGTTIDHNEVAYNNFAHFEVDSATGEAGGVKFTTTNGIQLLANTVHDNGGPGLWADGDSVNVSYIGNTIYNNATQGIQHELCFEATISGNTIMNNGTGDEVMNAQIFISNSRGAEIFQNTIVVDSARGNSIVLFQTYVDDVHNTTDNYVHDNDITFNGDFTQEGRGQVGFWDWGGNPDPLYYGNNFFDCNTYHADPAGSRWLYHYGLTWDDFRANGQEPNGNVDGGAAAQARRH